MVTFRNGVTLQSLAWDGRDVDEVFDNDVLVELLGLQGNENYEITNTVGTVVDRSTLRSGDVVTFSRSTGNKG